MTCEVCKPWRPRNRAHLEARKRLLARGGELQPCYKCKEIDWATTDEHLVPVEKQL